MRTTIRGTLAALLMALTTSASAATFSYALDVTGAQFFTITFNVSPSPIPQGLASYTFSSSIGLTDLTIPPDGVEASIFELPEFFRLSAGDSFATLVPFEDLGGSAALIGPGTFDFNAS